MKVLLVAPRTDLLLVDEEIQDILRSGLTVTPLVGRVSATELIREMRTGDYDVLWLATHGDNTGIQLSAGEMFPATEMVPHIRDRFSLVVLNTCNGLGVAQLLQEEAGCAVICTLLDVPDTMAYRTGARLASALAESTTVSDAYLASKPGRNREYLYLPALRAAKDSLDALSAEIRDMRQQMHKDGQIRTYLLVVALALHPVTWLIIYLMGRLT